MRYLLLAIGLCAVLSIALCAGSQYVPPSDVYNALTGRGDPVLHQIVTQIRLPRILLAAIAGAGLALAGAAFQSLLHNPLADPYILGVSSGAAIGAVLAMAIFGWSSTLALGGSAFLTASLAVGVVYALSRGGGGESGSDRMLLVGMAISSFSAAVLIIFLGRSSGNDARTILHWLIGDVSGRRFSEIVVFAPQILLLVGALLLLSHRFNLLALERDVAVSLGLDVRRHRGAGYLVASLLTASIVSLAGCVGFVGLVVPHLARILFSTDGRTLFPTSALLGATLLVAADTVGRSVFAPTEVPVGIVTAIIGAPLFVAILTGRRRRVVTETRA